MIKLKHINSKKFRINLKKIQKIRSRIELSRIKEKFQIFNKIHLRLIIWEEEAIVKKFKMMIDKKIKFWILNKTKYNSSQDRRIPK